MKKVLVTGATGFIGNYVIENLLQQQYIVIASSANIEKAKRASWYHLVNYIPLDFKRLDNSIDYYTYFQKPDLMIHLAWEGLPNYKASFHLEENLPNHYLLLKNLVINGLKDITVTGTCLEYGMEEGCLSENLPTKPSNAYAVAKDKLRISLEELEKENGCIIKWVRLFYMYGKGQNPNSLLSQLDNALASGDSVFNMSGGQQQRDFLPVNEVAKNIIKIALQNEVRGIINCCSGQPITVEVFVKNYVATIDKHIQLNFGYYPYTDYEPMHFWGDNRKLKSIING
ncbi:MAG: NAD-dependent epimerase/dehydratase family protein [Ferruginibacter sp.]